jgi:hypothetical protein
MMTPAQLAKYGIFLVTEQLTGLPGADDLAPSVFKSDKLPFILSRLPA